jgi:tetratricopeptide (TPR) repeat protein
LPTRRARAGRERSSDRRVFEELINEGFLLIEDKQVQEGITKLQRAAEISDENAALNLFIGEHFFRRGKSKHARTYLTRAHQALPDDQRVSLLLGLTCADDGEVEQAKNLLSKAMQQGGSSFAGHYGLGWLFVTEKNWRRALGEFKQALTARPSPEAHYVLGCLYYQLNRDGLAVRHLRKAVEMDESYAEAFYLLAQTYERGGQKELAREALKRAGHRATAAPLFQMTKSGYKRLIAGADKRLAAMLRDDALRAFEVTPQQSH